MKQGMEIVRKLCLVLLIAMLGGGLVACEEEGPAEEAGENIDESMEEMGEGTEEMGEDIEEEMEEE